MLRLWGKKAEKKTPDIKALRDSVHYWQKKYFDMLPDSAPVQLSLFDPSEAEVYDYAVPIGDYAYILYSDLWYLNNGYRLVYNTFWQETYWLPLDEKLTDSEYEADYSILFTQL